MRGCVVAAMVGALVPNLLACSALDPLTDCSVDEDCDFAERCNPEGDFCESRGEVRVVVIDSPPYSEEDMLNEAFVDAFVEDRGGIAGLPISLVSVSDQPLETFEARLIEELDQEPIAVLGASSLTALTISDLTLPREILSISNRATTPLLSTSQPERDRFAFRTVPPVNLGEAYPTLEYLTAESCETLTLAISRYSAYADGYELAADDLIPRAGRCIDRKVVLPASVRSTYPAFIEELDREGRGCVLLVADVREAFPILLPELRAAEEERGWDDLQLFATGNIRAPSVLEALRLDPPNDAPSLADGIIAGSVRRIERPWLAEIQEDIQDALPHVESEEQVRGVAALLDIVALVSLAATSAQSFDRIEVRDGLYDVTRPFGDQRLLGPKQLELAFDTLEAGGGVLYQGAARGTEFDDFGDVASETEAYRIVDGAVEVLTVYSAEEARAFNEAPPIECPEPRVVTVDE